MAVKTPITIAYGDGIGPEIMTAVLNILKAANTPLEYHAIDIGEKIYLQGFTSGIPNDAWDLLKKTKVLLKGPITTPQGGGYKSLNVTLRKALGLFANVRPCVSLYPYVSTKHPKMDLVIIRENEEGTYAGIEYKQTDEVIECLKIVTLPGCERVIHYAFEYARKFNRKKITCLTKDNIMKMTDGLFHKTFNDIASDYPDIETEHLIIDIGTALVAAEPERFDVIVTMNLYGDILSDVAAQIAGSVGLSGSANVGNHMAMFEAIHGSAPDIAGKKIANPSGLLNAAIQMLIHINQPEFATIIENAWLKTIEEGYHTADIYKAESSHKKVNTDEFAECVIANLGLKPSHFKPVEYRDDVRTRIECYGERKKQKIKKELVGVDIYIDNSENNINALAEKIKNLSQSMELIVISSRGLKIWPNCMIDTPDIHHCSCRFQSNSDLKQLKSISHQDIIRLLEECFQLGIDVIKTENLYTFDGKPGFSLAQGQ